MNVKGSRGFEKGPVKKENTECLNEEIKEK